MFSNDSFFMKLYYTVISAFSRKCRILARELNIIQDMQEVITTMRSTESIIMSINPTGKVPALITNEEQLITESYAICNYLERIANTNINSDNNYDNWKINGYETVAYQVLESIVYRSIEKKNKPKDFIYGATTDYEKFKVNRALDFLKKKHQNLTLTSTEFKSLFVLHLIQCIKTFQKKTGKKIDLCLMH